MKNHIESGDSNIIQETFIVDRIEGNILVLEDENMNIITIAKDDVVGEIKEGQVLIKKQERFYLDKEKTEAKIKKINDLMKGMWEE